MTDGNDPDLEGTVSWRELIVETAGRLAAAGVEQAAIEARWIVEEASGMDPTELVLGQERLATVRGVAQLDHLVGRRVAGEPIQYVLGHWPFRNLDLLVDGRVLIPRPETEQVVEVALAELDRTLLGRPPRHRPVVVDLGTGSGAIALAVATERVATQVWAADRSAEALAVARANLAGLGMAGSRVRIVEGSWFAALPADLAGQVDLVVSNPPYIAAAEELPAAVVDWEPTSALIPGPTGLEAYEELVGVAPRWLAPGGVLVLEIGSTQGRTVADLAADAGFDVAVHPDVAGHDRTVTARLRS